MNDSGFTIREIAREAGVSDATVDRVLHDRGGVRASTQAAVRRAIVELQRHQQAFELGGRTFTIDLVMHSPRRFSSAVWDAFESSRPDLRPADVRLRAHTREHFPLTELVDTLDAIAERGSHGVVLKAPDVDEVNQAVARLTAAGIPVLTIVTDLPHSQRLAYVGIDNRAAGATAAYLLHQWLPPAETSPTILLTLSSQRFRGEEEREIGFRAIARTMAPRWNLLDLGETEGLDRTVDAQIAELDPGISVDAVYSMGGANTAIGAALERRGDEPHVHIGHDLDRENRSLLAKGRLGAVLHHDLRADARRAVQLIMQAHGALPGKPTTEMSAVQVITPHNLPPRT